MRTAGTRIGSLGLVVALALSALGAPLGAAAQEERTKKAVRIGRLSPLSAEGCDEHLPAVYGERRLVDSGGLMFYGASLATMYRDAAVYADKILKGAKPADLPVEQPTKLELVINGKAARALGVTISPSLLVRADDVVGK